MRLKELGWFLPLRLASFVVLFAVVALWMGMPSSLKLPFIVYSVCTLAFALLMAMETRVRLRGLISLVIGLHFVSEIVVESGVVFASGGGNSPDYALYLLTIVSAALAYRLAGTLFIASLAAFSYAFVVWLSMSPESRLPGDAWIGQDTVFYNIFVHILIFYLIAFISGYLAERLKYRDRELADTSQALRRAQLETDEILRHLNSGLLTIDGGGRIIFFNRAAERILGYREEDVKGMNCADVFAERMPNLTQVLSDGLAQGVQNPRGELQVEKRDGGKIPLGLSTSALMEESGLPRGIIAIFSDLTDAKRLEDKVRSGDRLAAVGELSASIAHEIRNPLAAISGSVEVLKNELQVEGENGRLMALIVKESERLSKILTEFLMYSKIDKRSYEKVEVCHLISDVVQMLRHDPAFGSGIEVSLESEEAIVYVVGDEDMLKQLLLNLAVNACEAFDGCPGEINFRLLTGSADRATLLVEDNGPGIDSETIKRIYEPFYSTKSRGTGLGLAIVHRICTSLGLSVHVESDPGSGTSFAVGMHRYQAEDREPAAQLAPPEAATAPSALS